MLLVALVFVLLNLLKTQAKDEIETTFLLLKLDRWSVVTPNFFDVSQWSWQPKTCQENFVQIWW